MFIMTLQALFYYLYSKEENFDRLRPFVILINLVSLVWFYQLQFYRFKESGRACSGDYLLWGEEKPKKDLRASKVYLVEEGQWFLVYIICQYTVYIVCKIISLVITNNLE